MLVGVTVPITAASLDGGVVVGIGSRLTLTAAGDASNPVSVADRAAAFCALVCAVPSHEAACVTKKDRGSCRSQRGHVS